MKKLNTSVLISIVGVLLFLITIIFILSMKFSGPCFKGTIVEKQDNYLVVTLNRNNDIYTHAEQIVVLITEDTDVYLKGLEIGDRICVYYDGNILETYPSQVTAIRIVKYAKIYPVIV